MIITKERLVMRYSEQRDIIYNFVLSSYDHPSALDIYSSLKGDYPKLSLGTVYRNLNALVSKGLIKRIEVSGGYDRFDKTLMEHTHLLCVKCNKMSDVELSFKDIINKELGVAIATPNFLSY